MTRPAARRLDRTQHGPPLNGAGAPTVKIGHRNAWRVGDFHSCSMMNAPPPAGPGTPHGGGAVLKGSFTGLMGMQPAARQTDIVLEPAAIPPPMPPNNMITGGANKVLIGDLPFGLMDLASLRAFCAEWTKLRADWPNIRTEWERRVRTQELLNNTL